MSLSSPKTDLKTQGLFEKLRAASRRYKNGNFFTTKKLKKGAHNLNSPSIHSILATVLIKQIFEKNKSLWAAS